MAVLGFLGSLTGSVERFVSDVGGVADLEVQASSDDGFDEDLFFAIEQTDGVAAAVPMMSSVTVIERCRWPGPGSTDPGKDRAICTGGRQALFLGLDQRAEALATSIARGQRQRLISRSALARQAPGVFLGLPLARDLGVGEGDMIEVSSYGGERRLEVLGTVGGEAGRLNEGRFALTSIPLAQQLLGKIARLDSVWVLLDRGADAEAVERELTNLAAGAAIVDAPARRVTQARRATQSMRIGMQLGVGVGFVVAGFVIFNTMSVAAGERRRELATARALGGSRRRLLGLFLLEGGVLALAAAPPGSALGLVVSRRLVEAIPAGVASQVGVEVGFHLPAYALPMALAGSIGVALLATLPAAITAAMVSPVDAMRPEGVTESLDHVEGVGRLPTGVGLASTLVLFVLAATAPPVIGVAAVWGMFVSIILITYGLSHPIARLSGAVASRFGPAGRLSA
ncbi:MAG: ABC transporter permease, partial [Actinomycetota bacterium]